MAAPGRLVKDAVCQKSAIVRADAPRVLCTGRCGSAAQVCKIADLHGTIRKSGHHLKLAAHGSHVAAQVGITFVSRGHSFRVYRET